MGRNSVIHDNDIWIHLKIIQLFHVPILEPPLHLSIYVCMYVCVYLSIYSSRERSFTVINHTHIIARSKTQIKDQSGGENFG